MPPRSKKAEPALDPNTARLPERPLERFLQARDAIKQWEEVAKSARAELEEALGENEIGLDAAGHPRINWKHGKRTALSQRILRERFPDAAAECMETTVTRTFTVVDE